MVKLTVLGSCVSRVSLLDGIQSEHGIVDDRMDIDYFLDKQNIVCSMYPPPFPKEEVENLRDICIREKGAIRSLKQNLNKETLALVMDSDADYMVIDFMDMHMNQCKYHDTIFAPQANEFFRTDLDRKYGDEITKFRIYDEPWEEWIGYVDRFFSEMMRKYDKDHVILNRFRCNTVYLSKEGMVEIIPERFRGSSHPLPRLNEIGWKLEQYIIQKYQPWVIDLSKYFMGDENIWDNLQGAHFEREFYRETFDQIRRIVFGETTENYFSKPLFFDTGRRGYSEDAKLSFNIEEGLEKMIKLYHGDDLLWINLLDKLYMHAPSDKRVLEAMDERKTEIEKIIGR